VKESGGEVFGDNIVIKDWGNNPVDVYTKFEEDKDKKIKMSVAVDLGGTYLTSSADKDKYKYFEKLIKEFSLKMTKVPMEAAVKAAEKSLHKVENEQKDLEKENKDLKSDIENYKEKIKKAEADIKKNEEEQVKKKAEVEGQKKVTDELKKKLDKVN
jgi:peptidoglycan hydrolase CwlO-like protein